MQAKCGRSFERSFVLYRFSLASAFTWIVLFALGLGWVVDRNRLNTRLSAQQQEHEEVVDQLHLALTTLGEARELVFISREFAGKSLILAQLRKVSLLFSICHLVDKVDHYYASALAEAHEILMQLGCKSADDYVNMAKKQGYEKEDLLYTYEPGPGELDEFFTFLEQAIALNPPNPPAQ